MLALRTPLRRFYALSGFLLIAHANPALGQTGRDFRILDLERELTLFSASIGSGARALAMGGAFIAIADDGTAASWNPAGLGVLEESELALTLQPLFSETLTKPATRVVATAPLAESNPLFFGDTGETTLTRTSQSVDFVSLAAPIRIAGRKIVPQFSFQSVIPSLGAEFEGTPTEFILGCGERCREQRTTEGSAIVHSSGGIDVYAASLGIQLTDDWLLGASFNWWRGDTRTRIEDTSTELSSGKDTPRIDQEETETRNFSVTDERDELNGFNLNLGTIFTVSRHFQVGAVFKSPFKMHRQAEAMSETSLLYRSLREPAPLSYQNLFLEILLSSEGEIDWPATLGFGFAWFPASTVTLSTDFTWSNWSDTRYDETLTTRDYLSEESTTTQRNEFYPSEAQVDAWQYRLGSELVIVNPSFAKLIAVPLRAGFFLDRQYFLDVDGNTTLNRGFSTGAGLVWSRLTLDIAYLYAYAPREPAARVEEIAEGIVGAADTLEGLRQEFGEGRFTRHQILVTAIVRF